MQKRFAFLAAAVALVALSLNLTAAAPSSYVAFTSETRQLLASGDPERGQELFHQTLEGAGVNCAGCHGREGASINPAWPSLAGQNAAYLYKQLKDYKVGRRVIDDRFGALMAAYANYLNDQDMADVAAYMAEQDRPEATGRYSGVPNELLPDQELSQAERLVKRGDGARLIAACASCHGTQGQGQGIAVPALAGQNPVYFKETMLAYKEQVRANDVYSVMRNIVAELTDEEIRQLAAYYAGMD